MTPIRNLLAAAFATARLDLAFFRHHPRFAGAVAVVLCIPALYAGLYLSSLWDPASHTRNMHVALVNGDQGTDYQGQRVELGSRMLTSLQAEPRFEYLTMTDAGAARRAVDQGLASFAVIIPPDFSRNAMAGEQAGAARFIVHASEGNNYAGAGFARRFAPELAQHLNASLNEQRFAAVMRMASGSSDQLGQLRQAVQQLGDGASQLATGLKQAQNAGQQLADGAGQLANGSGQLQQGLQKLDGGAQQLTGGFRQTADAVHTMKGRMPPADDLKKLHQGAQEVAANQRELTTGLRTLEQGATQLRDGSAKLAEQGGKIPLYGKQVAQGAAQLQSGAEQLRGGLDIAAQGSQKLSQGAVQVADGVGSLTQGVAVLTEGLTKLDAAMPPPATLDAFTAGSATAAKAAGDLAAGSQKLHGGSTQLGAGLTQLSSGSERLRDGLALLHGKLPTDIPKAPGTAAGLSESVQATLEISAPVANQGTGMAPNFVPLSLWVGATLCTFLFAYRVLPSDLQHHPRLGIVLGKLTTPALVVMGQGTVLLATLVWGLHIQVQSMPRLVLTLGLTSLTFLLVLFTLVRLLGDAGKIVALVLLVLQLAASGATLPIELSSPFFQAVHPWLPLSWVVRATRIAMFGAFEGAWWQAVGTIAAMGAVLLTLATLPRTWRIVAPGDYEPLIET